MRSKPPAKLSDLIELAIRDGRGLDPNVYIPYSGKWHEPTTDEEPKCLVCLAGAVIAVTLGADPGLPAKPYGDELTDGWGDALIALDYVRVGDYVKAVGQLSGLVSDAENDRINKDVPMPAFGSFHTMDQFLAHLDELEVVAAALRTIGY